MLAPVTHVLPFTIIRRERVLQSSGKVLVRQGQAVGATDVIAEVNRYPEHILLDVARGLGISVESADKQIHCEVGMAVSKGDVIAGPVGLMRRVVRSTRNGKVILIGSGQVLIEVATPPFQLKAGIPGEVVELISDRGATIETTGALIQGVWGNGHIDYGLMIVLSNVLDQLLTPDQLEVSLRGSIVLGGHCQDADVLKSAKEMPLRGLILSSMDVSLIPIASKMSIPIIVLEGFGQRPMNEAMYKLLSTNERREVALNAEPWDRYEGTRPEIVIPLPETVGLTPPRDTDIFTVGQTVRILRAPYPGEVGILVQLKGVTTLQSGLRSPAAEIRLESGNVDILPLANLEVLQVGSA